MERGGSRTAEQGSAAGLFKAGAVSLRRPAWPISRPDLTPAVGRAGSVSSVLEPSAGVFDNILMRQASFPSASSPRDSYHL